MNLNKPVTINIPAANNSTITRTVSSTSILLIDNSAAKTVKANLFALYRPLTLWEKESYDSIGDYTQKQAEDRVNELLGDDPNSILEKLYNPHYSAKKQN